MRRYVGDPERTHKVLSGGHYHTGDLARRELDGSLSYLARSDGMFKSFGHRISPRELEEVLLRHPAVDDAAVVPVPGPVGLWAPKAYVVPADGHLPGPETARTLLAPACAELPSEEWIKVLEFVPVLPRTASGKVRRAQLRDRRAGEGFPPAPEEPRPTSLP